MVRVWNRFRDTELSDSMRLPRGPEILNNVTISLPPDFCCAHSEKVGEHALDVSDVDAQLHCAAVGNCSAGHGAGHGPADSISAVMASNTSYNYTGAS